MLTINNKNKILGEGSSGIVFEGVWEGFPVAIKRINVNDTKSSEREVKALQHFNHENVIKLLHVEEDNDFKYLIN
jgi:serine/threonine protein kinase